MTDSERRAWDAFRHGASLERIAAILGVTPPEADRWIDSARERNAPRRARGAPKPLSWASKNRPTRVEDFEAWQKQREIDARSGEYGGWNVRKNVRDVAASLGVEIPEWARVRRVRPAKSEAA